ncbi:hypothetical protein BU23DRAFT_569346 [Bimuria novae-zelandiae CBS 107.79]|uniref:Uncharacterized protein n=1 Tax=Bimuria novae-zelandiae CBS 107.79 TaxID=1447943 RepID=A0A6A5V4S9_9PLEO|nr:hypothetical protein BU23DRAFT_569346 [Bimuria novae-zelandiae CBS 107.79]
MCKRTFLTHVCAHTYPHSTIMCANARDRFIRRPCDNPVTQIFAKDQFCMRGIRQLYSELWDLKESQDRGEAVWETKAWSYDEVCMSSSSLVVGVHHAQCESGRMSRPGKRKHTKVSTKERVRMPSYSKVLEALCADVEMAFDMLPRCFSEHSLPLNRAASQQAHRPMGRLDLRRRVWWVSRKLESLRDKVSLVGETFGTLRLRSTVPNSKRPLRGPKVGLSGESSKGWACWSPSLCSLRSGAIVWSFPGGTLELSSSSSLRVRKDSGRGRDIGQGGDGRWVGSEYVGTEGGFML